MTILSWLKSSMLSAVLVSAALGGCASNFPMRADIGMSRQAGAHVPGIPKARVWGDAPPDQLLAAVGLEDQTLHKGCPKKQTKILALSGGGEDGAFGAGYLVGLSASGSRPSYDVVTGVSTGALIAPFAFLGPSADHDLRRFYTETTEQDIVTPRPLLIAAGFSDALMDSTPLRQKIEAIVDKAFLQKIAAEHRKGRRLFVVTTNLDAQRAVIWNIGEIAQSQTARSITLIQRILLASASIPSIFPPVAIPARSTDGMEFDEMHVDGGTTMQILAIPESFVEYTGGRHCGPTVKLDAVINGRLDAEFGLVPAETLAIAERSISTLIKVSTKAGLTAARALAERREIDLSVTSIGPDFEAPRSRQPFDQSYMRALFAYGISKAPRNRS